MLLALACISYPSAAPAGHATGWERQYTIRGLAFDGPPDPPPAPPAPVYAAEPPAPTPAPQPAPAPAERSLADIVCSYDWDCAEAMYVAGVETGGTYDPNAVNRSSGACGLFQLLPCTCIEVECNVAGAYAKWLAGGRSFYAAWYQWWS